MTTTMLHGFPAECTAPHAHAAPADKTIPRHLAFALDAGGQMRAPSLQEASAALRTILEGCQAKNIPVLTLLRPTAEDETFEAALPSAKNKAPSVHVNVSQSRNGRAELLEAVRLLALKARQGELRAEEIDAARLDACLSTQGLPAIDMLISTGGGSRLGGALLWQCAYAELLFVEVPWFAFTRAHFDEALRDYAQRCRKFGGLA